MHTAQIILEGNGFAGAFFVNTCSKINLGTPSKSDMNDH